MSDGSLALARITDRCGSDPAICGQCAGSIAGSRVSLAPDRPWTLDFAEHACFARRLFGSENEQVYLELSQYGPSSTLQLVVTSDDFARRLKRLETTFIPEIESDREHDNALPISNSTFGEGFVTDVSLMTAAESEAERLATEAGREWNLPPETRDAREREISGLLIENGFQRPIYLETGSMHPIMNAMRQCLDNLLESWGLDVDAHRTLSLEVVPRNQERWVRELVRRYPNRELSQGRQARINIRLLVSTEGIPSDCAIQNSMNVEAFNELACELLLEHSRFDPALDQNGQPIASYWRTRIFYTIG